MPDLPVTLTADAVFDQMTALIALGPVVAILIFILAVRLAPLFVRTFKKLTSSR